VPAVRGKLGQGVSLEEGQRAARLCAINILAQAQSALGDLGRIRRCVRLGGFVASAPDFTDQHKVVNGASDLIAGILGEAGKHARAAVGVASLPLDAAVEVEALFAVDPA
jgi:enamine deaminase RidA (YjgF/YER057c/UK114 family)